MNFVRMSASVSLSYSCLCRSAAAERGFPANVRKGDTVFSKRINSPGITKYLVFWLATSLRAYAQLICYSFLRIRHGSAKQGIQFLSIGLVLIGWIVQSALVRSGDAFYGLPNLTLPPIRQLSWRRPVFNFHYLPEVYLDS